MRGDIMAQITLYNTTSEPNAIRKNLYDGVTFTGTYRHYVDEVRPEVLIESTVTGYNYAYIADFGRYYFIDELTVVRTGVTRCVMHSDPLMSFQSAILSLPCICRRTERYSDQTPYIHDTQQQFMAYRDVETYALGDIGGNIDYILVTAG